MIRNAGRSTVALVIAAALGGCSSVGGGAAGTPEPSVSYPELRGAWMGALQIEGQGYNGMLEVMQMGPDLRMRVEIPTIGLTTNGMGTVLPDGTLRVSFRYELECPGDAEFVGEVSADDTVMQGTLLASDCTGDLRGTFRFSR